MEQEQRLIASARAGDRHAYAALVRQYEQLAFRAAYLVTRESADAADAAQEAFVRAYRALGSFQMGRPFRPWLLRIVTNLALNRVQAAQRQAHLSQRWGEQMRVSADHPSPEATLLEREQSERLVQAVRRLPSAEQTLIQLRYFLELPEAEVAEILNVPRGTVKSRLHRTMAKLRELIKKEFPDLVELAREP